MRTIKMNKTIVLLLKFFKNITLIFVFNIIALFDQHGIHSPFTFNYFLIFLKIRLFII